MNENLPLPYLTRYLQNTNPLTYVQIGLFFVVTYCVFERSMRVRGWLNPGMNGSERVAGRLVEELTRLCFALGLLLTFSGLYSYLGSTTKDNWSLLLALGSSAIGYSTWTMCAIGGVVDAMRGRATGDVTSGADIIEPPPIVECVAAAPISEESAIDRGRWRHGGNGAEVVDGEDGLTSLVGDSIHTDEAIERYLMDATKEDDDEQEPAADTNGGRGYLGGPVHHADPSASNMGSLGGFERYRDFDDECARRGDGSVAEEGWD